MSGLHLHRGQRYGSASGRRIDVDALRSSISLSGIVGQRVKLKREGSELVGLCPFHNEHTPSFRVNDARGAFYCFGCRARGDVIRFVMVTEGLTFLEACRSLANDDRPVTAAPAIAAARAVETAERQAKAADAKLLWTTAFGIAGTPADLYLRRRGINFGCTQPALRFARSPSWKDYTTGRTGPCLPTLVGAVGDLDGDVIAVQRIFLTEDGTKAGMRKPKLSLGPIKGGALRLGPPPTDEIILCEGPEDGLTLAQELGMPVWVALGTANLPAITLPDAIRLVTIAGDNNLPGRAAVAAAATAYSSQRRTVRTMFPDPMFVDFNDQLQGITR